MPGTKPAIDPTFAEALDAMTKLKLIGAEEARLEATVKAYVDRHGPLIAESDGKPYLWADNRQTITETFDAAVIAAAADEAGIPPGYVVLLLSDARLNALMKGYPPDDLKQQVAQLGYDTKNIAEKLAATKALTQDDSGGMIWKYGKPSIDARKSPAEDGKNHVVLPGEKPLVAERREMVIADEEGEE
jgi:hypothetical protein